MVRGPPPALVLISAVALFIWFIVYTHADRDTPRLSQEVGQFKAPWKSTPKVEIPTLKPASQHGEAVASKLGNETLKAELGRASWKLFHTMMARFPDEPTQNESDALKSYIYLFGRLYPCGECATHFQQILKKYPPQTSSRSTAAAWACLVHNEVNISKDKPIFDCSNIGDWYDCGCAEDEKDEMGLAGSQAQKTTDGKEELPEPVKIEKEGLTRGG